MEWWHILALIIVVWIVIRGLKRSGTSQAQRFIKSRPELVDMAMRAQREGATHFESSGPAVAFYRTRGGKVERCFAEFAPTINRYVWIWEPPDWREHKYGIPERAKPIPEF